MILIKSYQVSLLTKAIIILIIALSIRFGYLYFVSLNALETADSHEYEALAESIINNQSYFTRLSSSPGSFLADLQRPLGYPLFLALITIDGNVNKLHVAIAQSILASLFAAGLVVIVSKLTTDKIGILTGLLYALDWVSILHTPLILADFIYSIMLTGGVLSFSFYLLRPKAHFVLFAGLWIGVAALIKPAAQLVVIHLVVILLIYLKPKKSCVLLLILGYGLITFPWMLRNQYQHGVFTLSAISTPALYFYTAGGALENESLFVYNSNKIEKFIIGESDYWRTLNVSSLDRKKMMEQKAWTIISSHWPNVIKQSFFGLVRTCIGTGKETLASSLAIRLSPQMLLLVGTIFPLTQILFYWALAIIGAVKEFRTNAFFKAFIPVIVLVIFFILLPSAMPLGYSRFRTHAAPLLCMLASMGISKLQVRNVIAVPIINRL